MMRHVSVYTAAAFRGPSAAAFRGPSAAAAFRGHSAAAALRGQYYYTAVRRALPKALGLSLLPRASGARYASARYASTLSPEDRSSDNNLHEESGSSDSSDSIHFGVSPSEQREGAGVIVPTEDDPDYSLVHGASHESGMLHPVWTDAAVQGVRVTHIKPETLTDRLAFLSVKALRLSFDVASGYALGRLDERAWLNRVVFLESVAGVPGIVGAAIRHLRSLRRMERDYGWIHTLLEEAENERMHLMTALALRQPGFLFRVGVLLTQGIFVAAFTSSYLLSRRFAHRFVGYLEEEAVKTYTHLLAEMDAGSLPLFSAQPAPKLAKKYWLLDDNAMLREVILAIRADEAHHRQVNHTFAEMGANEPNPFPPGK